MREERAPSPMRTAGFLLLAFWAVLFLLGALGELFDVEFLKNLLDLKRLFLR